MARTLVLFVIGVLAMLLSVAGPAAAGKSADRLRVHVQGHMGSSGPGVDIDVPWESDKGGSPFDFTADACDRVAIERLRQTWATLQRLPEGRVVTFETRSGETMHASRQANYLVLEPQPDHGDDHHARIKIPDYIVRTVLDGNGRMTDRDIERLVRERGKVMLVKVNSDVGGVTVWLDRGEDHDRDRSD